MVDVATGGGKLRLALGLTLGILLIELAGGLYSHSLALLSDAGHVLTDVFALGLAWFALEQSGRPADQRRSYGYQRVGILAALVNSAALIVIVVAIAFEAVPPPLAPEPVQGGVVIATTPGGGPIKVFVLLNLGGGGRNPNLRASPCRVTAG